jgi:hypothetical protein
MTTEPMVWAKSSSVRMSAEVNSTLVTSYAEMTSQRSCIGEIAINS